MSSQPEPQQSQAFDQSYGNTRQMSQQVGSKRRVSSNAPKPLAKRVHTSAEDDKLATVKSLSETAEVGDEMEDLQPSRSQSIDDHEPNGCVTPEADTEEHEQLSRWSFDKDYFPPQQTLSQTPSPRSGSNAQSPLSGATETNIWRLQYMGLQEPRSLSEALNAVTEDDMIMLERHRRNAISGMEPEFRSFRRNSKMEQDNESDEEE